MTQASHEVVELAPASMHVSDGVAPARPAATHAPLAEHVTLERLALGGCLAWIALFTFLRWPAPVIEGYYSNSSIDASR